MGRPRASFIMAAAMILAALTVISCGKNRTERTGNYDKVMILYAAGYNSLSSYIHEDLGDLKNGYLPGKNSSDAIILITKLPASYGDYVTKTSPCIVSLTSRKSGKKTITVSDTLKVLEPGTVLADAVTLRQCLEFVKDEFPAKSYGMVVSSHATGWLPNGYFDNSSAYDRGYQSGRYGRNANLPALPLYVEREQDPSLPAVKSIGQEVETIDRWKYSREITIEDFASSIPMHLDYLLLDACLMGGIEVAYAFRKVTDVIGFSQTEVLADGYDYTSITSHLLARSTPDPKSVCEDFFNIYDSQDDTYLRSATISLVDCSKVDAIAEVCSRLFEKYRNRISLLPQSAVQAYFYNNAHHWHFDMLDIVRKAGADEKDLAELESAINASLIYKAATPSFLGLRIDTACGYSMYLPSAGSPYLDNFYRSLSWNMATGLVSE